MSAAIAAAFFWLFRDKVCLRAEAVDGDAGQARVQQPGG